MDRDRVWLADMVENIEHALSFTEGGKDQFLDDRKTAMAVLRCLEVLGEASKRVSPKLREAHPEVPWSLMAKMRDRLIHDYGNVNAHTVWVVIEDELPGLLEKLRTIQKDRQS